MVIYNLPPDSQYKILVHLPLPKLLVFMEKFHSNAATNSYCKKLGKYKVMKLINVDV